MIDEEGIRVAVEGNKVILKGKVRTLAEKIYAERVAWLTSNVPFVENRLDITEEGSGG